MKTHDLKTVIVNNTAVNYFYTREKNDVNGNPRFRVYIIDPDGSAIYESIVKTYEWRISDHVTKFIDDNTIPQF